MKKIKTSAIMLALTIAALPAMARTAAPNISIPSSQNSGTGIAGLPGDEAGPAVQPGAMPGASAAMRPSSLSVREQDTADIRGLPGTEAGPSMKPPSRFN
ncbi:hypothetical protein JQ615_18720 [Bradyrhizobium jicamae]|uniref:Uncharacterized protein n=1 Tax=Bradyrhizobium jicamae TaxID=280332 RepID=A0ABS5FKX0_9BRAD|nr:hypothetical protein [Bradyrhizobium jicamae]MBR0797425.1 hypothetical protein [Bradyrhizobium jicamae]MBR0939007.1 hypothetical protein [Bradyrhizobium jicamae]